MKKFFLEIESKKSNIKKVEELMLRANDFFGLSDDEYNRLMIAVTEIVMNAIVHGNKENPDKKVTVNVECNDRMVIRVNDEGTGFDITHLPDPTTSENILDAHGRGIFIAKAMVDEFDYEHREGKGTEFRIIVKKK